MKKLDFAIGANDAGQRADKFLLKAMRNLPPSLLYKTFRRRDVKLNGKRIPAETFLQAGDALCIFLNTCPRHCCIQAGNAHCWNSLT